MMDYETFISQFTKSLQESLGPNYTCVRQSITKVNEVKDALAVRKVDIQVAPSLHLQKYYCAYQFGNTLDDLIHIATETIMNAY